MIPFSEGPRACLSKNLALIELKLITAALVKNLVVGMSSGTTEDSMAMADHLLVSRKGGRCDLGFTPLKER